MASTAQSNFYGKCWLGVGLTNKKAGSSLLSGCFVSGPMLQQLYLMTAVVQNYVERYRVDVA